MRVKSQLSKPTANHLHCQTFISSVWTHSRPVQRSPDGQPQSHSMRNPNINLLRHHREYGQNHMFGETERARGSAPGIPRSAGLFPGNKWQHELLLKELKSYLKRHTYLCVHCTWARHIACNESNKEHWEKTVKNFTHQGTCAVMMWQ